MSSSSHPDKNVDKEAPHLGTRRAFLGAAAACATTLGSAYAEAGRPRPVARPPSGFSPLNLPGQVVKVTQRGSLQANGLWPMEEAARSMLHRAMSELTGDADVGAAFRRFVSPEDRVAIKLNGIAGQTGGTMATNRELALAVVEGLIASGVPASSISFYEQYPKFLAGTRVANAQCVMDPAFPAGIRAYVHENRDATMSQIVVAGTATRFVRPFTDATAVINLGLMKDHAICGYTGCLKNITHGSTVNPHAFHQHLASPQIALLYAQDIVRSRVRLHITDAFKVIYDGGPLDKNRLRRVPHESVYVGTDPVAMDVVGWGVVEALRQEHGLPSLRDVGREPLYLRAAGELGLGVFSEDAIRLREIVL